MRLSPRVLAVAVAMTVAVSAVGRAADSEEPGIGGRGRAADASAELHASFSGRSYTIRYMGAGNPELDGLGERLRLELINFLEPVRDDGTPYSLQSFLQRTNWISLHVDIGRFDTTNSFGSTVRKNWDANLGAGVNLYPRPWLNLFASASYDYDSLDDITTGETTHSFSGSGGLGLRHADARFRASYYALTQHSSKSSPPFRQGVILSAFAAFARRFTVSLIGETIPQGGDGQLTLEYFQSRKLGIFAGSLIGRGQFYRTGPATSRYGGSAGVAGWMYGRMELLAEYSFTYESTSRSTPVTVNDPIQVGYHQVTHALLFETNFRFR